MKLFALCFTTICLIGVSKAQTVQIVLKDGSKLNETIKANSESQIFLASGSINYTNIKEIKFESNDKKNQKLQERLFKAGVSVYIQEGEQIIDYSDQPQKGDKKFILVCSDSLDVLYKRIGQHLSLKGYAIENSSRDFLTIKTTLRETSKFNYSYFLNVVVINNKINIKAQWKLNNGILVGTNESGFFDWEFTDDKDGVFTSTVNSIIYNDLTKNLSDFDKLRVLVKYKKKATHRGLFISKFLRLTSCIC